ncbi:outer membrane beta-barrel protein [Ferruginibacter albus]|uniref:outer membrane beta-barrel protein n=1 Tax=Ferruginibacter albus TaxID=2875540 RepID=UPI001CC7C2C2|nr:outer membrane beta-barrel protein [Ferruginibacter albus]UAY51946.1 outer membrane beta-barrel protein [Ferruginibacter albus]
MKQLLALFLIFNLMSAKSNAQTSSLKGKLVDQSDKTPVAGATIQIESTDSLHKQISVVSAEDGSFILNDVQLKQSYNLFISFVGYDRIDQQVFIDTTDKDLGTIEFSKSVGEELTGVTVTAKTPPVQQKQDTIQYNASQFKTNPDATAEELMAKLPGVTVDKSGTVTAQGDQVKSVTVDGKKFFGDDASAALRNLPAEIIDKIQVFDKLSDQAAFTGFDDGSSVRAINIVTKSNMRNGQFGRLYAGYGTDQRYNAGGNVNFFNGDRRISIVGLFNNVNQQNFSSQDLLGFGSGGGRGGRGGGVPAIGAQSGINTTNAIGINFTDTWGKKLDVQGSYFFNYGNNVNNQTSHTQYLLANDSSSFEDQTSNSDSKNWNHRVNFRFDYKIDSSNSLLITPTLSFQNNNGFNNSNATYYVTDVNSLTNALLSNSHSDASGYNLNNNILYRHAFAKKGRTLSLSVTTGLNKNDRDSYLQTNNTDYINNIEDSVNRYSNNKTSGYQLSGNVAYTEPLGKKGQLQLNYSPSYSKNKSTADVFNYDNSLSKYADMDTSLSNNFENTVSSQNGGVSYRLGDKNEMFSVGANYQYTLLNSDKIFPFAGNIHKSFDNVLPNLMWRKKVSAKANIRLFYRMSTSAPSISQLQNVINNANPLFVTTGNPDLKQQVGNTLSFRYTYSNTDKSNSFFANIYLQQYNNYIGNASTIATADSVYNNDTLYFKGAQITRPTNLDGYVSMRSFFTYGFPLKALKSNINLNAGLSLTRTPVVVQGNPSFTNNYNYNAGVVVASNVSQYVDFTLSYSAGINVARNEKETELNNNYFSQTAGIKFNLLDKKGWFLQNDLSLQAYSGLTAGLNQSYWLWNVAMGKKFLADQRGELKLSVFDLLKQNQSISRTVSEKSIEDDRNLVLQQYFMLTFTYKLKSFGTPPAKEQGNFRGGSGGGGFHGGAGNIPSF